MIQSANGSAGFEQIIAALADNDPFACRIVSLFRCYPPQLVFVDYWLIRDEESGEVTGAIARNGSNFILLMTDRTDLEETASFMRVAGAEGIICNGKYELDLGRPSVTGPVLVCTEPTANDDGCELITPDIRDAYDLIVRSADERFRPPVFEDFYVDVNHKLRHNAMSLCGVEEGGTPVAIAMTVAESDDGAVLGAVACLPEYRKRGFGSKVVGSLTARLLSQNKRVYLHRAQNANAAFYEKLGFTECGTWREYE